jgi:hypothetical protein
MRCSSIAHSKSKFVYLYFTCYSLSDTYSRSRRDSESVATGYGLGGGVVGVRVPRESRILYSSSRPDRLWGPPNLRPNKKSGRGLKLTTHLYAFMAWCLICCAQGQLYLLHIQGPSHCEASCYGMTGKLIDSVFNLGWTQDPYGLAPAPLAYFPYFE